MRLAYQLVAGLSNSKAAEGYILRPTHDTDCLTCTCDSIYSAAPRTRQPVTTNQRDVGFLRGGAGAGRSRVSSAESPRATIASMTSTARPRTSKAEHPNGAVRVDSAAKRTMSAAGCIDDGSNEKQPASPNRSSLPCQFRLQVRRRRAAAHQRVRLHCPKCTGTSSVAQLVHR